MNFQALKGMIDSVVEGYTCPDCKTGVGEENIDIVGTAGTNINLEVICPKCGRTSVVKGQVLMMDLSAMQLNEEKIKELQKEIGKGDGKISDIDGLLSGKIKKTNCIKDKEISNLSKTLKSDTISMSDLFGEEEVVSEKKSKK